MRIGADHPFWSTRQPAPVEQIEQCASRVVLSLQLGTFRAQGSQSNGTVDYRVYSVGDGCLIYIMFYDGRFAFTACFQEDDGYKHYFGHPDYPYLEAFMGMADFLKFHSLISGDTDDQGISLRDTETAVG